jgi:hypothetical protein
MIPIDKDIDRITGLKRMEFWSTGVLLYKLVLQYSITPILQQKIPLSCQNYNVLGQMILMGINDLVISNMKY